MKLDIAQSTPTAASIAQIVRSHYALGEVVESEFLRRSFNQVYRLTFASGQRVVARLCADRPRGEPNVAFESAVLAHLAQAGCPVARCLPAVNGEAAVQVLLPEGPRQLMLFEYVDGEFTSESAEDIQAFAQGLARLHEVWRKLSGPCQCIHAGFGLPAESPARRIAVRSYHAAELRPQYQALAARLQSDILALGELSHSSCHGDAHGSNNFIINSSEQDQKHAVFFDFNETGPGYLSYELAVYPWNLIPRSPDGVMSEKAMLQWQHFISAYCKVRPVAEADLIAIPRFMAVRQFWLLGEYAGRVPVWGSQAMPTDYLRRQVTMLRQWEKLTLPM
ncbi:MAG: phosphotransferase [Betaproteobacteria bacterium]|nr:phosphotransferase [Betaproteobacteria bacterium]